MFENVQAIDIKKDKDKPYVGFYKGVRSEDTQFGPQKIFAFKDAEGAKFEIKGFTNLDAQMEKVQVGNLVRLTYTGTVHMKTRFGMKDVHQVTVEVDREVKEEEASVPF